MKLKSWILITCSLLMGTSAFAGQPTYKMGETMFVETGVEAPDLNPTWYAAMVAKPYAPVFEMLATQGTQGRYYPYTYPVTLKDMVRYHGHDCEGTTTAANSACVGARPNSAANTCTASFSFLLNTYFFKFNFIQYG